ncbi:hypothetical protein [Agrobacterium vitis]|uniref:hypothetical protein n=1 Tax=Agrobacterium vitis TaxID=373 RepID=UPI0012E85F0A|nr:hypothetical protein [Agrobacterium vitis]MUZ65308.1 hypothetical protein [Agrobacterium vitis]
MAKTVEQKPPVRGVLNIFAVKPSDLTMIAPEYSDARLGWQHAEELRKALGTVAELARVDCGRASSFSIPHQMVRTPALESRTYLQQAVSDTQQAEKA